MPQVLDIEQAVLLLEIEPPFGKRDIQLARRRLAKVWHPDIAPPGRQLEHERHLKAINEAADQLEQLAEESRGGKVTRNAVKVGAAAARKRRAEEGAARLRGGAARRASTPPTAPKHDPFGSRVPDHSVVHRYARCLSYPEWGVGSVNGIYFTGGGDDIQQWARVSFHLGVRTVPAGSLQFVDFSKPDPGAERVAALHDRRQARARRGRLRARRPAAGLRARRRAAQHGRAAADDARLLAGRRLLGGRPRRARLDPRGGRAPGAVPLRGPHLRGHGLAHAGGRRRQRRRSTARPATPPPGSGSGRLRHAHLRSRGRARGARARARARRRASRACSTSRWSRT